MSTEDYRARYDAGLAADEGPGDDAPAPVPAADAGGVARDADQPADRRIAAVDALQTTAAVSDDRAARDDAVGVLLDLLRDSGAEPTVRRAALDELQAMTFIPATFAPYAAVYRLALQSVAVDQDAAMRDRALEILTLEGDEGTQRILLEDLQGGEGNLVEPARALQLLGQEAHARDRGLVQQIAENATDDGGRIEALRALGADPAAVPLFQQIAEDKNETAAARATSLLALQTLAGDEFPAVAERLARDASDWDDVRTLAVTALVVQPGPTPPGLDQLPDDDDQSPQREEAMRLYQRSEDPTDD